MRWIYSFLTLSLAVALLGAALPAARAQDPAGGPTPLSPIKVMPASISLFLDINLEQGGNFRASLKDTQLGRDFDEMLAGPSGKNVRVILALLQGFGQHIGLGMILPAKGGDQPHPAPQFLAVAPVVNSDQVSVEAAMVTNLISADRNWTWKDEPEGAVSVHVAVGNMKPGQPVPAYALLPGALIVGTSPEIVHAAVKTGTGQAPSLADSDGFKALEGRVDQTQFAWGYMNSAAIKDTPAAPLGGMQIDPTTIPGISDILQAYRGSVFSVALQPDRVDMQRVTSYDPTSPFGKALQGFQKTPMHAPALAFGRSLVFADVPDMQHMGPVLDGVITPLFQFLNTMVGDNPGGQQFAAMLGGLMDAVDKIVTGSGPEIAIDVAPLNTGPNGIQPPTIVCMIQKSDKAKLQEGINNLMQGLSVITHQEPQNVTMLNRNVAVMGDANSPIRISYVATDDYHLIGSNLDAVRTPLYLSTGVNPQKSLAADPGFQQVLKLVGPDVCSLAYVDTHALAHLIQSSAATRAQRSKAPAGQPGAAAAPPATNETAPPDAANGSGQKLVRDLVNAIGQLGDASVPDPAGMADHLVLTFNPNAGPDVNGAAPPANAEAPAAAQ